MSGYKYQSTPTIMLKGNWLKELGFDIGDYISVSCENGKLVITQDVEMAAVKEAEAADADSGEDRIIFPAENENDRCKDCCDAA
jgi:antitoxin component of MazEF toxin-antitoxin module